MRLFIICLLSLITGNLFSQVTTTGNASASIIVSEVGVTDLVENEIITFAVAKGQTVSPPEINTAKTFKILSFKVVSNNNDFSITVPSTYRLAKNGDDTGDYISAALLVNNQSNNPYISISTTFKENDFQLPGNYYSPPFEITVNYY